MDEEYQALLMVIGEMDLNDLEKFANNSYIYSDTFWNGSHPKLSPVFIRLAEKYESIMTKIVESGILTSGQLKDEWEKNLMHHLETAAYPKLHLQNERTRLDATRKICNN